MTSVYLTMVLIDVMLRLDSCSPWCSPLITGQDARRRVERECARRCREVTEKDLGSQTGIWLQYKEKGQIGSCRYLKGTFTLENRHRKSEE